MITEKNHWLFAILVALILGFFPASGKTLGFGQIKLFSYLNEPLEAEIELRGSEEAETNQLITSLASAQDFKRADLARPYFLTKLRFEVIKENGKAFIRVSSEEPVKQPYLEFLVVLSWPSGRVVKGYTVLLDPAPMGGADKREETALLDESKKNKKTSGIPLQTYQALGEAVNSVVESLEPLFEEEKKEIVPVPVAKSEPVTIQSSKKEDVKVSNNKVELVENNTKKEKTGLNNKLLLLFSSIGLFLVVGITGWILKRVAFRTSNGYSHTALVPENDTFDEEVEMKLSLARQYLDIQDKDSARELLETVVIVAKEKEREIARELLEEIS